MPRIFLLVSIAILVGCSEEAFSPKTENPLNILPDVPTYENTAAILSFLGNQNIENINGRTESTLYSFEDAYQEALSELNSLDNPDDINSTIARYSNVIQIKDSVIYPLIMDGTYRKIISPERLYRSDGLVHKVIDDKYIVFTDDSHTEQLLDIVTIEGLDTLVYKVVEYGQHSLSIDNARLESYCANPIIATYTKDVSGCRKDRRVQAGVAAAFMVSGNNYTPKIEFTVWAQRKITGCIWVNYNTTLYWQNSSASFDYRINNIYYTLNESGYYSRPSGSVGNQNAIVLPVVSSSLTEYWNGGITPQIQMTSLHHEASSRGIGSGANWAIVDCQ